jgi:23S rRNA pseudouridine2457 synthase
METIAEKQLFDAVALYTELLYLLIMRIRNAPRSYLFYKPYGVLCQFSPVAGKQTLAAFGPFPRDVYPVGRLDEESEGLLVLTNDNHLKQYLTEPRYGHPRTYLVQVERIPDSNALERLASGVSLHGQITRPASVRLCQEEPKLPPRPKPVRFRKTVPISWLEMILQEGRNRQVRRMTAAVGHPTLRLVRIRIGDLTTAGLLPGEWREISEKEVRHIVAGQTGSR